MPEQIPVHLDCDTGIDDSLAIAQLIGRPDVDLVGISTVSGNIDATQGAVNTRRLLALAGREDIPVAAGPDEPLVGGYRGGTPQVHGANGIGEVQLPPTAGESEGGSGEDMDGPHLIVRSAKEHPGELELLAVGPLTNLARALEIEPDLPRLVKRLTIMGGAVWVPGNVTEHAEANIENDPEAAQIVFDASWPIVLVPLDVTLQHTIGTSEQQRLRDRGTAFHRAIADMLDTYFDFYEKFFGHRECALHDPLAGMLATGDSNPRTVRTTALAVDPSGTAERGRTRPVEDGHPVEVVTEVEQPAGPLLMERMLAVPTPDAPTA